MSIKDCIEKLKQYIKKEKNEKIKLKDYKTKLEEVKKQEKNIFSSDMEELKKYYPEYSYFYKVLENAILQAKYQKYINYKKYWSNPMILLENTFEIMRILSSGSLIGLVVKAVTEDNILDFVKEKIYLIIVVIFFVIFCIFAVAVSMRKLGEYKETWGRHTGVYYRLSFCICEFLNSDRKDEARKKFEKCIFEELNKNVSSFEENMKGEKK